MPIDIKRLAKIADQMMTDNDPVVLMAAKKCRDLLRASGKLWQHALLDKHPDQPTYEDGYKAGLHEGFRKGYAKGAEAGISRTYNHILGINPERDADATRHTSPTPKSPPATKITKPIVVCGRIRLVKRTVSKCIISFANDEFHIKEVNLLNREELHKVSQVAPINVEIMLTPDSPMPSGVISAVL